MWEHTGNNSIQQQKQAGVLMKFLQRERQKTEKSIEQDEPHT